MNASLSESIISHIKRCPQTSRGCNADLLVGRHVSLFQKFRKLDYDGQSQNLSQIISLQEPERRRVEENVSRRHCTVKYSINYTQQKYPDANNISLRVYHDIFKSKFNLRFALPRSDTCSYCDKLFMNFCSNDDANEKKRSEIESEIHHRKAETGYKTLKDDTDTSKLNPNYVVLCTDLQQVLFCPNLTHSSVFYQRQFSTYNYAVHNMGEENAKMLLSHEAMAHWGSTEIASALLFYITNKYSRQKPSEERKLVVWSNRNNHSVIIILEI
ncbi:unnamed protein product [Acanthoscelides obtectus]|uniref:Uncharacterized protein n=1 Tax=Acanthoscelides obtectus TaxID=200917 RepID=A0A9P0KKB8_ACAOB|nr:unnamed protein product [Acanthoscelides obtectus]CAK1685449.1 hypothetical protein AOBTE_LOCUS35412 [Acanthoscelides obtectus]